MLLALAAVVVFVEEFGWRPLAALLGRIAHWPPIVGAERWVAGLRPLPAMLLFLAPSAFLFPLKLFALWLIDDGRAILGALVIVVAKVIGTALVGRLFILLEPQLRTFAWFVAAMDWWQGVRARVRDAWQASGVRRAAQRLRLRWRRWRQRSFGGQR